MFNSMMNKGTSPRYASMIVSSPTHMIGSVYGNWAVIDDTIYERSGNTWSVNSTVPDISAFNNPQVKVWDDVMAVRYESSNDVVLKIYRLSGTTWSVEHTETFTNNDAPLFTDYNKFPSNLAIADGVIVIGMSSYVEYNGTYSAWFQYGKAFIVTETSPGVWSVDTTVDFSGGNTHRYGGYMVAVDPVSKVVVVGEGTDTSDWGTYTASGSSYSFDSSYTNPYPSSYNPGGAFNNNSLFASKHLHEWNGSSWSTNATTNGRHIFSWSADREYAGLWDTTHDKLFRYNSSDINEEFFILNSPINTYDSGVDCVGSWGTHSGTDLNCFVVHTLAETRLYYRLDESIL